MFPFKKDARKTYPRHSYYHLELEKDQFKRQLLEYFNGEKLEAIFELELEKDYLHFEVPFYAEKNPGDRGGSVLVAILSLFYHIDQISIINDKEFFKFIQFFSEQLSMAWNNLQENIALKIQEQIDKKIRFGIKGSIHSKDQELKVISGILAREFDCPLCCFFLVNQRENTISLENANIEIKRTIKYNLNKDTKELSVQSFNTNRNFRIFGRKRVEKLANREKIKIIEEEAKRAGIIEKIPGNYKDSCRDICIEHWLSVVINVGDIKLGLINLFRLKGINDIKGSNRFDYKSPPLSEFEANLLERIQKHIFNILIAQQTIRQRMQEMDDFLHQVMGPLNALIAASSNLADGIVAENEIQGKYRDIFSLARTASNYVSNYRKIFEIESGNVDLEKEEITDLKKYLKDLALVYQPHIQKKYLCIHVTDQTKGNIKIKLDKTLFDLVILNLLDNAVKYSFHAEERIKIGLQARPASPDDRENVLITALENDSEVIITISNWGLEIPNGEKDNIFKREFRGYKARMSIAKGAGIGLYIARDIVQRHGGTTELVPTHHKNNIVFKVTLPKIKEEVK